MASDTGVAIVIMGVSGAGKSVLRFGKITESAAWIMTIELHRVCDFKNARTIGEMLAKSLNGCFIDADDYHPQSNKDKMKNGIPLTDDDRIPWIETLRDALIVRSANGGTVILGCSALKESYREILRHADPRYVRGSYICGVKFVLLDVGAEILGARLEKRAAGGQHFMPAKLLESQLDSLQFDESEGILRVDASQDPQTTLKNIQTLIGS